MAKYFCRVEYLESTGEQWINAGVNVDTSTDEIKLYFQLTDTALYKWFFGEYDTNARIGLGSGDGENKRNFLYQQSATKVSDAQMYNKQHLFEINSNGGFLDGTKIRDYVNFASTSSIYLFNLNIDSSSDYRCKSKIWKYEHKRNGVLIKELVPCLDNNGRPAMYDNVSKQLFYNQGTGEFNVGRQIHPVEYLESTGGQYIDTGIQPTDDYGYRIRNTYTAGQGEQCAIGCMDAGNRFVGIYTSGSANAVSGAWGDYVGFLPSYPWTTGTILDVKCNYKNSRKIIIDNTEIKDISDVHIPGTISNTIYIGARHYGSNVTKMQGKIYSVEITKGQEVIANYIPAIDENLVPFMFDPANCKIYENAGTGQFKVGKYLEQFGANKKLLRKKYDMMLSSCFKKKPYYCEVEYLESTGTQYINTGLLSTADSKVDCTFGFSSMESGVANNVGVFGGRSGQQSTTFTLFKIASVTPQYFRFDFNGQANVANANQMTWNTTSKYRFEYNGTNCITTNTTTGESTTNTKSPASTFTSYPICLFAVNTSGTIGQYLSGRIYRYWYTDGTNTIDLIPVLDWNMTPCMYDKISGQLFYNQGTGDFLYGREIHYVEYLETTSQVSTSTTKPWINTLVDYWADFEIGVKLRESASNVCLSCGGGSYRLERINATNPYWRFQGGGNGYNYDSTIPITEYHVLKWKDGKISCDGEVLVERDHLLNSGTYTALFTNSTASGNTIYPNVVYFLKMWNPTDGTLVRDYLPAIDENGVGFMLDKITHTIYDNAGTGAFKYPARQLEYIESTGTQYIDTGVYLTNNHIVEVDYQLTVASQSRKGLYGGLVTNGARHGALTSPSNQYLEAGYGSSNVYYQLGLPDTNRHVLKQAKNELYFDGALVYTFETATFTQNFTAPLGNFNYTNYNPVSAKYYGSKWTDNVTVVRDFIPCFKDGQAGMWDKANSVLYQNAGTGSFSVGKIKEKEWEEV